jgi:hypothetical protein
LNATQIGHAIWVVQFVWFGLVWFGLVDATFPSWPDLHQATRVEFFFYASTDPVQAEDRL